MAGDLEAIVEITCKARQPERDNRLGVMPWADWHQIWGAPTREQVTEGEVYVASPAGDEATILGFVIRYGNLIRMVYVKRAFRGLGIGVQLLIAAQCTDPWIPNACWNRWRRVG